MAGLPRDEKGQFFTTRCPDPHCGGNLIYESPGRFGHDGWICGGLTHDRDDGPLYACDYQHTDGEPRSDAWNRPALGETP